MSFNPLVSSAHKPIFCFGMQFEHLFLHKIQDTPILIRLILFHLIYMGRNCFFGSEKEYQEYLHLNNI